MPLADTKKCQHFIDAAAEAAEQVQQAATRLSALRTAFQQAGPDVAGTPLDGNVAAASNWIDDVIAAAGAPVATALVAAKSKRHRPHTALGEL